jgi:hypothetical protein
MNRAVEHLRQQQAEIEVEDLLCYIGTSTCWVGIILSYQK